MSTAMQPPSMTLAEAARMLADAMRDKSYLDLPMGQDLGRYLRQGSRGGSSRFRGVTWDRSRGKWMASAMLDGRRRTIGRFDTEVEAGWAAAEWRREHMPFSDEARTAA